MSRRDRISLGYITAAEVEKTGSTMKNSSYGAYLQQLLREKVF